MHTFLFFGKVRERILLSVIIGASSDAPDTLWKKGNEGNKKEGWGSPSSTRMFNDVDEGRTTEKIPEL